MVEVNEALTVERDPQPVVHAICHASNYTVAIKRIVRKMNVGIPSRPHPKESERSIADIPVPEHGIPVCNSSRIENTAIELQHRVCDRLARRQRIRNLIQR